MSAPSCATSFMLPQRVYRPAALPSRAAPIDAAALAGRHRDQLPLNPQIVDFSVPPVG